MDYESKSWMLANVVWFRRTTDPLGALSNFAPDMPVHVNGQTISSSEHLYQAMRFPHLPKLQARVLKAKTPADCKSVARQSDASTRDDWMDIRVAVMRWVLAKKIQSNFEQMSRLFAETGDKPIVEFSIRDPFWGAQPQADHEEVLVGQNVLGCLLTELRNELRQDAKLQLFLEPRFTRALLLSMPV